MKKAIEDLLAEIEYAKKWGTKFDDLNTANDWSAYVSIYCGRATEMTGNAPGEPLDRERFRKNMLKVASLAMHAVHSVDRGGPRPRHYDPERLKWKATWVQSFELVR